MSLTIDFWQLVGLLLSGLGVLVAVMKFGVSQAQKHQDATHKQVLARLDAMEKSAAQWQSIEREMLQMKADMPLQYVRREDYIRGQSVIEAKLDAVASKLEIAQLRVASIGVKHAN
ncbi:hypothetical protein [Comamonas suwonensis]|uniref:Uncharacterized protein n=1 Tax=Comamonas suwonensis TaxID=2606214 RepID=A0A843BC98_9BURK|nr:hypothetical protein [Comamonas suwonensis]MBI1626932.1 hypothetical protein [Comamonas suwonensis]